MPELGLVIGGTDATDRAEAEKATTTGGFSSAAATYPISISEPHFNLPCSSTYTPTTRLDLEGPYSTHIPDSETTLSLRAGPVKLYFSFCRGS